ncbi:lycopene beta-cyclase [Lewinella marina]|uniref:Lycopene cyclase n=1 Tax=Neolewinella marina TaxID=438751 RepID=A0A2G0CDZ9_9BACT|nr:lycopene cyclase family protein [Neolewinella marina]NJB87548.1 lycopene beta-cyclase [Neolewinella marina]PHK98147.1 lycopene cyclase [Neolewinella marina]
MNDYDIAVAGGGLAGLSLLYHFARAGKLRGKRVLLVDPERKSVHDRTWSYWERGAGPFDDIVAHRWERVTLANSTGHCTCDLRPYAYKLIRSTDFYAKVNPVVDAIEGLTYLPARISSVEKTPTGARLIADGKEYKADRVYSSLPHPLDYREVRQPYLDQHFRGWFVETTEPTFDPDRPTFMDFRTPQAGETRFFYVLPFSKTHALVEVAIFGNHHLTTEAYDALLRDYIGEHWTRSDYRITHSESGNIPMTTYPFPRRDGNLIYIGLGGGAARPSTGYTFYGLQRQLARMAAAYPEPATVAPWPARHLLYDATLLRILERSAVAGEEVFVDLFRRNPPARVLAFLNGESSLWEELRLMSTVPLAPFARHFLGETLGNRGR